MIRFHSSLHPFKQFLIDDCRNSIRDHDFGIPVFSDVLPILQNQTDPANGERNATSGSQATVIERLPNVRDPLSGIKPCVDFPNHWRFDRVNRQNAGGFVHIVSIWNIAAVVLAFHGIVVLSTLDFLGQFRRIVFGVALQHGFQDNSLWAVRDVLFRGNDPDTMLFQDVLVMGAVIAISGKAVQLPDQYRIKKSALAVGNHALKFRPVRRSGGQRSVNIRPQQGDSVSGGIFRTFPNLTLNGFLTLAFRRVAGINYSFHFLPPFLL